MSIDQHALITAAQELVKDDTGMDADAKARVRGLTKDVIGSDIPCPECGKRCSRVVDTRGTNGGAIRRRRECVCRRRFTTYEHIGKEPRSLSSKLNRIEMMIEGLRDVLESAKTDVREFENDAHAQDVA